MTVDVSTRQPMAAAIRAYAARLHAAIGDGHHVASPLGAWVLLALCAPCSAGRGRGELAAILGMDIDAAFAAASHLLDRRHEAMSAACGAWTRDGVATEAFASWLARLPVATTRGSIPTQAELDDWVRRETLGVLDRSALRVHPEAVLMLASIVATRVTWTTPFRTHPARLLGATSPWATSLTRVLASSKGHIECIVATQRIGDVAVHAVPARGGIDVVSVIADAGVAPRDVLDTAYEIAAAVGNEEPLARRSLYDMPLGSTARWTISESEVTGYDGERGESHRAFLPAWSATTSLQLDDPALGFSTASDALGSLLTEPMARTEAMHAVRARYSRTGFEAAAETSLAMMFGRSMWPDGKALMRSAELRFCHPFAVVAVVHDGSDYDPAAGGLVRRPWGGLPIFSAWVAEPEDAEPDPDDDELSSNVPEDDDGFERDCAAIEKALRPRRGWLEWLRRR